MDLFMLIAQLSDTHIKPSGRLAYKRVDTSLMLGTAIDHLRQLPQTPDLIVITGDLVDEGSIEEYKILRQFLTDLPAPYLLIPGNHDDFMREYIGLTFGSLEVHNEYIWKDTFITHGDLYDGVVQLKWLGILGSVGYDIAISIDRFLKRLGVRRSLSKYLKSKVKEAMKFITQYELELVRQAKKNKCKVVLSGHIHLPEDKKVDGIRYLNCGDWIENNSYITYNNGKYNVHKFKG
jgi:3',5'-cyclic AMP phosphodiesterase CpdA